MGALDALLDGPRAERASLLKAVFAGTWSITAEDRSPLSVIVVARGEATYTHDAVRHQVRAGDVVLTRGPAPYTVADSPATPPDLRILPGQVGVDCSGAVLAESSSLGIRTWGNARPSAATVMLIGAYQRATSVGGLLLAQLPPSVVLHDFDSALVEMLGAELVDDSPGQTVVVDRLLDLVVVHAVRALLDRSASPLDPAVARALLTMETHPERPWTVETLAAAVGLSRAALARRFTRQVGETPLAHLTRWRLALAADLLAATDLPLAAIAERVGYSNQFALSTAFKRAHGVPPSHFRLAHAV